MNLYFSNHHSDEEGHLPEKGKAAVFSGSKEELLEVCNFFEELKSYLKKHENCHRHFRDYKDNWNPKKDIDIIIVGE